MPILTLKTKDKLIEIPFSGEPLLSSVLESAGVAFSSPCGGNGKCGKCIVDVVGDVSTPSNREAALGKRLACKTVLLGDATVSLPDGYGEYAYIEAETGKIKAENSGIKYGAVLDLGTTTLALKLFSGNGDVLAEATEINPQRSVSADVIGRINASLYGKGGFLQAIVVETINKMLENACETANISPSEIEKTVVVGNTAMLYLLCGYNPKSISASPFSADNLFGKEISSPIKAYLPPCINAFVGADLVCSVLASNMCDRSETSLLCDIGTNGEIALWRNGRLYVTSAAAGPAFEGAEISCGSQCVEGAIDAVWQENGKVLVRTVNGAPAVGICGSGLIDAVATFLELGYIDASGNSPDKLKLPVREADIYITNEDIRALQLAKSAICSAIISLLEAANTNLSEIKRLYLCGGFGNKLNIKSAVKIGLIPAELEEKAYPIGNGALTGGALLLLDAAYTEKAKAVVNNATHIGLGGNETFNKLFIDNIPFEKN